VIGAAIAGVFSPSWQLAIVAVTGVIAAIAMARGLPRSNERQV